MKKMSQMKEILIAVAAVATLASCQPTEKEKLITQKLEEIDWYLDYYRGMGVMQPDSANIALDIMRKPYLERTEKEEDIYFRFLYYMDKIKEKKEEREYWVLQQ